MNPIIEEIRRKKRLYGYTYEELAKLSGLPVSTVQKVLGGVTKSPGVQTVEALQRAFSDENAAAYGPVGGADYLVREAPVYVVKGANATNTANADCYTYTNAPIGKYPRQGSYTLTDYYALPDEQRVELIDGVFYDMSAPSSPHQLVGGEIHRQISNFLRDKKGTCVPFMAPVDVQLDKDEKTMLQPDVLVVCDRTKITRRCVVGAPDFVMEVLSPSTMKKDILIKLMKYWNAGVREYWMVDMEDETVTKMLFSSPGAEDGRREPFHRVYNFDEPVPVGIFQNQLSINFREIQEAYQFILENGQR
ncbi:MAG: Uma2 family endonuclease [Lachnospiraceae bacterium]|nr:Uma2 family endonuclease [Lachnospiraceae bacterium]